MLDGRLDSIVVKDATAEEMRSYLQSSGAELDEFDIEEAIYWFASDWHSGQWSNLYSALSTSQFKPSPLANGPGSDEAYSLLEAQYVRFNQ